jgi:hypothetical protein
MIKKNNFSQHPLHVCRWSTVKTKLFMLCLHSN